MGVTAMKGLRFDGRRTRLAGALALAGVITLVFASVAGAQTTSPSEYPPPPPSPLAPPDWVFDDVDKVKPLVGDVNFDSRTDIADATIIFASTMGLDSLDTNERAVGDTTNDVPVPKVDIADATHIFAYTMDRTGNLGILYKPLWEWPQDSALRDPEGLNAG